MLSPNGVCYKISESPFKHERNGLVFKFSSLTHKNKFDREVEKKERWLNDSLARRFYLGSADFSIAADVQLYQQIEKRGFFIEDVESGEVYESWLEVKLDGLHVRKNDCEMQLDNLMQQLPE